jgi:hypothetical protein
MSMSPIDDTEDTSDYGEAQGPEGSRSWYGGLNITSDYGRSDGLIFLFIMQQILLVILYIKITFL